MERPADTVADPMTGRLLDGRYRVGERIARGGMATVYEAEDLRLDRRCAVKVMHAQLADAGAHQDDFAARFVREARAAARLSHPNVVAVTDQGTDGGALFLVMELVPGRTLRDLIRNEAPVAPARALALLEPVLAALAEAHRSGLVHRDVKPENVLLADDGRVKVADFGLARAFDAAGSATSSATTGVLIGTVSYLAPELIVSGRADPRADVYGAGVLLFELLTGRKPHEGEGAIQIAYKHVNQDVPRPSSLLSGGLPSAVDALVARATARDAALRPADAKVLLHQVRRVRAALDAGAADDPELTADLTPTVVVPAESIDYEGSGRPPADAEPTTVIGARLPEQPTPGPRTPGQPTNRPAAAPPAAPRPVRSPYATPTRPATPRGATPATRGRRRRGPLLLLSVVLLTALLAYGGWWFGVGRYTSTPGVTNLSVRQATAKLAAEGLEPDVVREEFSETVTAGSVISTSPEGGDRVLEGGTVDLVVSRGPERYEVPPLRGRPEADATQALEDENLVLDDVERRWNEEVPAGTILSTVPGAGAELRPGSPVDVVVSRGPKPITIPDLTGKDADRAEARLDALGFAVARVERNSDDVPEGDVIRQSPDEGTGYAEDEVTLVVSKGPVLVEVPQVVGDSIEGARAELEAAGLRMDVRRTDVYIGLDTVVTQDPGGGDAIPKGSVVVVSVV